LDEPYVFNLTNCNADVCELFPADLIKAQRIGFADLQVGDLILSFTDDYKPAWNEVTFVSRKYELMRVYWSVDNGERYMCWGDTPIYIKKKLKQEVA